MTTKILKKSDTDAAPVGQQIAALLAGLSSAELDALFTAVRARADLVYSTLPATRNTAVAVVQDEAPPTPQRHGATGNWITDDTTALEAFLAAGYSQGYVPPGVYKTTSMLTVPIATMNLQLADGATIKAGAGMAAVLDTPVGTQARRATIRGGVLACNNLAATGLLARFFADLNLLDMVITDPAGDALVLGDAGASASSYGAFIRGLKVDRPSRSAKVAGSRGIYTPNATDSDIAMSQIVGCDIGVRLEGGYHQLVLMKVWGYSNSLPTTCYDDNGSENEFLSCMGDTPTLYCFRLRGQSSKIIGGKSYLNNLFGVDNTVTGVFIDTASAFATILGHTFQGADGTHRLAADIAGSGSLTNLTSWAHQRANVVASIPDQSPSTQTQTGLVVVGGTPGSGQQKLNVGSSFSSDMSLVNGIDFAGYKNNFTTKTLRLRTSVGGIQPGTAAGVGATIYSGSGAPNITGSVAGDYYYRTDTPSTANQRIYIATAANTWSAIL